MHRTNDKMLWLTVATAFAASAVPASAEIYLTESQALGVVLGDHAVVRREQKNLDPVQRKRLEDASGLRFPEAFVTFFIAAQDGKPVKYAIVMNEIGKSEPITFMVGMTPDGKVAEVVIMEFRENRGWEVKEKRFLNQFRGKSAKNAIRIDEDIVNYTGATLSSKAVARGVKRALLLLDALYPGEARYKLSAARDFAIPDELNPIAMDGTLGLYRQTRFAMGTHCEIRAWCFSASEARAALAKGFGELERIEQIFSAYRDTSELNHLNRNAGNGIAHVSPEFFRLARIALSASRRTEGAVNIAVGPLADLWKRCETEQRWPANGEIAESRMLADARKIKLSSASHSIRLENAGMKLDFGGIAKGYAAEKIGKLLRELGVASALVNLGRSSLYATALHEDFAARNARENVFHQAGEWPLAILKPSESGGVAKVLWLGPGNAVSTSGTTERGFVIHGEQLSHLLNPMTGFPLRGRRSATVIGRNGVEAEIASKALLLAEKVA